MSTLANASSERTFARYVKALRQVFDGISRPALGVDWERRELRLVAEATGTARGQVHS